MISQKRLLIKMEEHGTASRTFDGVPLGPGGQAYHGQASKGHNGRQNANLPSNFLRNGWNTWHS